MFLSHASPSQTGAQFGRALPSFGGIVERRRDGAPVAARRDFARLSGRGVRGSAGFGLRSRGEWMGAWAEKNQKFRSKHMPSTFFVLERLFSFAQRMSFHSYARHFFQNNIPRLFLRRCCPLTRTRAKCAKGSLNLEKSSRRFGQSSTTDRAKTLRGKRSLQKMPSRPRNLVTACSPAM